MERIPMESSNIRSAGYDAAAQELEVEFNNGRVYRYPGVPENMWFEMEGAPSKGKYFSGQILPRFKDVGYRVQ